MKKLLLLLLCVPLLYSCAENNEEKTNKSATKEVDICRCLNEPGNTDWAKENKEDCNKAISNKIGVSNWEYINFFSKR